MSEQLRLDGTEVPAGLTVAAYALTPAQREILAVIDENGHITSTEAGTIIHRQRQASNPRITNPQYIEIMHRYACADGLEACKRLMKRNLLRRESPGRWVRP